MSYNLQAEGLNGVNVQTSIIAGHDWVPNLEEGLGSPESTVLFVSGLALDIPSPANIDAISARGRLVGNGVTGFGGDVGGAGVVGVAGGVVPATGGISPITGQTVGVYGTGVAGLVSAPAVGVLGQGGPANAGVIGRGGTGNADGVQGFGVGDFSGAVGFGDPNGNGTGVLGIAGGPNSVGVRGVGGNGTAAGTCPGVVGNAGPKAPNDGVQGFGNENFSGVAGFGDPNGSGTGVFGTGRGPNSAGVRGIGGGGPNNDPLSAAGVYGQAGSGNANGVEGRGSGNFAGVAGFGDVSSGAGGGIGVFAVGGAPPTGSSQPGGPGVYAVGHGGPNYTPLAQAVGVYGIGGAGDAPGVLGQGGSAAANGVQGLSASGSGIVGQSNTGVGVRASSSSETGLVAEGGKIGLVATAILPGGVAAQFDGNVVVSGDFTVGGKKSLAVPFPDGSHRRLYCVESPENWFEDFGFGQLIDGQAEVQLDAGFRSIVIAEAYHVFVTEYESNNALYVTKRTRKGFVVQASGSKTNGAFSYRVVAKRKDNAAPRFEEVALLRPYLGGNP
jgi:hypothetical protein